MITHDTFLYERIGGWWGGGVGGIPATTERFIKLDPYKIMSIQYSKVLAEYESQVSFKVICACAIIFLRSIQEGTAAAADI